MISAHSAKGLEFDIVIIYGVDQGVFPTIPENHDNYDGIHINNQRKLLFVAITRAKQECFMVSFGETPSRFIGEIGLDKIHCIVKNRESYEKLYIKIKDYYEKTRITLQGDLSQLDIDHKGGESADVVDLENIFVQAKNEQKFKDDEERISNHIKFCSQKIQDAENLLSINQIIGEQAKCGIYGYYHMTTPKQLQEIINDGYLYSHNKCQEMGKGETQLGDLEIINNSNDNGRRIVERDGESYETGSIHDYVRTYINPKNAMSYRLHSCNNPYILLEVAPEVLLYGKWRFSDRNASANDETVRYIVDLNELTKLDWNEVFAERWVKNGTRDVELMKKMQAEFQVEEKLPIEFVFKIYVNDESSYNAVKKICKPVDIDIELDRERFW